MTSETKKNSYQAPALEKGLDILEYLARESVSLNQAQIADAVGRNQSEIYRMLACLESRGYVHKEAGAYRLSLRMYQVGRSQHVATELRRAARLPMELLAEQTGQSCHLSVQYGGELMVMLERTPTRRLCLSVGEGSLFPLWRTASGKILLGQLPSEERDLLLARDPGFKLLPKQFKQRTLKVIEQATADGHIEQPSDLTDGVRDIAVPVGLSGGEGAVLALSSLENPQLDSTDTSSLLAAVRACSSQININLGVSLQ